MKNTLISFLVFLLFQTLGTVLLAQTPIEIKVDTIILPCGQGGTVTVPVQVNNLSNVSSIQFSLKWDKQTLTYLGHTGLEPAFQNPFLFNVDETTHVDSGIVTFSWLKLAPITVTQPDATILSFNFAYSGTGPGNISLQSAPSVIEFSDASSSTLPFVAVPGYVGPMDTQAPALTCPASVVVANVQGATVLSQSIAATVTDDCGTPGLSYSLSGATQGNFPNNFDASFQIFQPGLTLVRYRAIDLAGNTSTCQFSVELQPADDTLTLYLNHPAQVECGAPIFVDVTASNFDTLGSLQFSLAWPSAALRFDSVGMVNAALGAGAQFNNINAASQPTGSLGFSWYIFNANGLNLPGNSTLFRVYFTALSTNGGSAANIQFTDAPVIKEAYRQQPYSAITARFLNSSLSITDNIAPTITCPAAVSVQPDASSVNATVPGLAATASDNCGVPSVAYSVAGSIVRSGQGAAGGLFGPGQSTVTFTATDGINATTCSTTVTVAMIQAAEFYFDTLYAGCMHGGQAKVCLRVRNFEPVAGVQFQVNWDGSLLEFQSIDDVPAGISLATGSVTSDSLRVIGFYTNSTTVWPDLPDGSILACFNFNVLGAGNTSVSIHTGTSGFQFQVSDVNFARLAATTQAGYFSSEDLTSPTFTTCSGNLTFNAAANKCDISVSWTDISATDDCGSLASYTASHGPNGGVFSVGVTEVSYTAVDQAGNSSVCSFTVTVRDITPPTLNNCPTDTLRIALVGACEVAGGWAIPTATDLCALSPNSPQSNIQPTDLLSVGVYDVLYQAIDTSGNSASCAFVVVIEDNTTPTFTDCPANFTVDVPSGSCSAVVTWTEPTLVDDACLPSNGGVTSNFQPGVVLGIGVHTINYVGVDAAGNVGEPCMFTVTVQDTVAPVFANCPSNIEIILPNDTCSVAVDWTPPSLSDNACLPANGGLSSNFTPLHEFGAGTTTVIYAGVDSSGNQVACSFDVIVRDTVAPVFSNCPSNRIVILDAVSCTATNLWTAPTLADNSCLPANGGISANYQPGDGFGIGNYTVTYVGLDSAGNIAQCIFEIQIRDTIAPVFTNCPADITLSVGNNDCTAVGNWVSPTLNDACLPASGGITTNIDSDSLLSLGTYLVQFTGFDAGGNFAVPCSFSVTVRDIIPPVISNCPRDTVVNAATFIYNYAVPTATDNCGIASLTFSHPSGTLFTADTVVQIIAIDLSGNADTCSFSVNVNDCGGAAATVICPADTTVNGVCSYTPSFATPVYSGFCTNNIVFSVSPIPNGASYAPGNYTVNFSIADAQDVATCSFNLIVRDDIAPSIACPPNVTVDITGNIISDAGNFISTISATENCDSILINYNRPVATDNCGTPIQGSNPPSGRKFVAGTSSFTFTASDASGNDAQPCIVRVQINGIPPLTIAASATKICMGSPVTLTAPNYPNATYQWSGPGGNFANTPSITIDTFQSSNAGAYDLTVITGQCTLDATSAINLSIASQPIAVNDFYSVVEYEPIDTIRVLQNDTLFGSNVTVSLLSPVTGISQIGNGLFSFAGSEKSGQFITFQYQICSVDCPNLCATATASVFVKNTLCDVFPKAITPNDDGINDEFLIPCLEFGEYNQNSIQIYSQWGDLVFEASPYLYDKAKAFKGLKNNTPGAVLPDGTYYYLFKTAPTAVPFKGFIQIVR